MKKWFEGISDLDALKARYRELAKTHHPDHGGSVQDMQEINAEYDKLSAVLPKRKADGTTYQPRPEQREAPEKFRAAVMAVINLNGVEIELCGSWLWATGNTKPHKDIFKRAGYQWSQNKQSWFWHEEGYQKTSKKKFSLDEIRDMYGSERLKASAEEKQEERKEKQISFQHKLAQAV